MEPQEYPTDNQIEDSFEAYKKKGKEGLLGYLKAQQKLRESPESAKAPEK